MSERSKVSGLLLAGGHSDRMGTDKAVLRLDGEPLAARAAGVLKQVAGEVIVASGDGRRLDWLGLPQVADLAPGEGPLAGLVPGLEAARSPLVAVLAVDMPYANPDLLELCADLFDGEDAVVPRSDEGLEPLHAVYAKSAVGPLRAAFHGGERSLRRALAELEVRIVAEWEWFPVDPGGWFARNVNVPDDLR